MAERQFGPYRLVHQIAVGGMAEIHLAKTGGIAGFEKYVALKMIHPNFSSDEQFIQMLIDEAKITVQLQHANIAQIFDLGRVGDAYYITMEYVDGCDLYQLLRRSSERNLDTPVDICAFVGKEVATGLDYAHRKRDLRGVPLGIVHRDVSPQNVLISHAGEVKLVDFGIAKATMRARQTAVGVIKGKYYYMSPEQAWGDELDHRSDVFSTGILLHEMLTGQMLYLEEDVQRLLGMVRKAAIAPPTTLRPDIPPQLERIVMHCLQEHPDDRYRTAADLAADLERFLHVYSPVFAAGKLAKHVADAMAVELTPSPIEPPKSDAIRSAHHVTQRVHQAEVVRSHREFTDENSVIFNVHDMVRDMADEPPKPRMAQSLTRQAPDEDFSGDRTVIDDIPPSFDTPAPAARAAHDSLEDDDHEPTGVRSVGGELADDNAPTVIRKRMHQHIEEPFAPPPPTPDAFKVSRGDLPRWIWRLGVAVVCVVLGVLIGVLWLEDQDAPATASVEIVSIPQGATVTINGQRQPGRSPVVVANVEPGAQYRIVVEMAGFRRWERREDIPIGSGPVTVIASLQPVLMTLHVESTPPAAEVFLNGRSVGRTPLTLTRVAPTAARIIELRKPSYAPQRRTLDWSTQTTQRQQFTLEK